MDNQTFPAGFYIVGFTNDANKKKTLFIVFLFIYLIGIVGNLIIITVIYLDSHLQTPMYLFLCNLSSVDICYTTVTLPKLMDMLATEHNSITFTQCFTQMYFFNFLATTEVFLLTAMAYDRYAAICFPLQYYLIMNRKKCTCILISVWVSGCMNSLFFSGFASTLTFCYSNKIQHFFCDVKPLVKISCSNGIFYIVMYVETVFLGIFPLFLSLTSYVKIISSILQIKSVEGRKRAFSTCTSHLTVLFIFYGTFLWMYIRPTSDDLDKQDVVISVLYTAVTPMLNPLIYSLRNKEMKSAMVRLVKVIKFRISVR
ncbi:olfactory receptor 1468-like [Spea bombifrons]|uniref:olfactory receptor 1468-like n=1 Tax=Spea bombifrons TaxID=233779 RepID=UPI002349F8E3|nr:olfactory receptor 1468-like [Spea bombifrons]